MISCERAVYWINCGLPLLQFFDRQHETKKNYPRFFNSINSQIKLTLTRFVDMKQEYHLNLVKTTRVCHVNIKNIVIKNRLHAISTMSFYHNTIINYLNKTNKHKQTNKHKTTKHTIASFFFSSLFFFVSLLYVYYYTYIIYIFF